MDGEITIGTRLDTDKFDRQIADLEKKMQKEEDKKVLVQAKLDTQETDLEKARAKTDELGDAYQRLAELKEKVNKTPTEFTQMQGLESQYGSLEKLDTSFNKALDKQIALEQKVAVTKAQYDGLNQKVSEYKQKIENVKIEKQVADVEKLKSGFNNVGSSIQGAVKHVARLALGIFGLKSAFMFLRRASSDLASYDQQYATNLEYIRYALTQMIAPVLQWIVNLAAKLLGYINAIMQGWFGINLFSRGSAENFNKMKAGASGVSKAVKQIKKDLAGWDEVTMLTDQSDTGTAGGIGGIATPNFDLSAMQGEVPEWLQWIIDHKDEILSTLAGIGAGLVFLKLGELAKNLGLIKGEMLGIKAIGFGILVKGIIDLITSLKDYLKDPSWENFGKVVKAIGEIILGVGILIGNVPLIVAGAITLIMGLIIQHWEDIKQFFQNGIDWLADKSDWVHEMFGDTIGNIYDTFVENLQLILNWFDMTFKNIKQILDGIIEFVTGVFSGDWEKAWEGIENIFGGIFNWIGNTAKTVLQMAWNLVKNFATTGANTVAGIFKTIVNAVLRTIESVLNSPIRAVNRLIGVINAVPGINLSTLPTFNLPRLKVGGIINMPNKGTMLGSAIGGESGREGVIPLTDQQAMAQLGAEIGKNVVVNLTNITKVGNRQIAREIKRINAEQEFAFNV